jgi:hypothetical protein
MEKRPNLALVSRANGLLGTMTRRAIGRVTAGFLLLATPVMAAEPPAELISNFCRGFISPGAHRPPPGGR